MENDTEKKILDVLSKHPEGITIIDISKKTNVHRNTISKYIFALSKTGIVKQRKVGVASLCYLEKKRKVKIGKKSLAKISLGLLFLAIISVFAIRYTLPATAQPDFSKCDINITWSSNSTYIIDQNNTYYCLNQKPPSSKLIGILTQTSTGFP